MVAVALYLVITPFKSSPIGCLIALVMILLGLPVYFLFVASRLLPSGFFASVGKSSLIFRCCCTTVILLYFSLLIGVC